VRKSGGCAAGVFTSPIALQVLVELFDKYNSLDNLQKFVSNNAINIYGVKPSSKVVELEEKEFIVPELYEYNHEKVVPMYAGEAIKWSIVSIKC
jgi:dihydroorotase